MVPESDQMLRRVAAFAPQAPQKTDSRDGARRTRDARAALCTDFRRALGPRCNAPQADGRQPDGAPGQDPASGRCRTETIGNVCGRCAPAGGLDQL